jgi:hypothetical protein
MNNFGKARYCFHSQHFAPADSFRFLPGLKHKREGVCCLPIQDHGSP